MKKLSALYLTATAYASLAMPAFADSIDPCPGGEESAVRGGAGFFRLCSLNFTGGLVGKIITVAFIIATVIALAFLIYGGIRWITSGGDKTGVETARNTIVAALVGLVIVFLAYFLIRIIFTFFGLSFENFTIPTL